MTLPTDGDLLKFSSGEIEDGAIAWIVFLSLVQNDGPRFHLL
jgi:hypothetical protein